MKTEQSRLENGRFGKRTFLRRWSKRLVIGVFVVGVANGTVGAAQVVTKNVDRLTAKEVVATVVTPEKCEIKDVETYVDCKTTEYMESNYFKEETEDLLAAFWEDRRITAKHRIQDAVITRIEQLYLPK